MRTRITKRRRSWLLVTGTLAVALVVTTACSPSPSQARAWRERRSGGRPVLLWHKIVFFPGGTPGGGSRPSSITAQRPPRLH